MNKCLVIYENNAMYFPIVPKISFDFMMLIVEFLQKCDGCANFFRKVFCRCSSLLWCLLVLQMYNICSWLREIALICNANFFCDILVLRLLILEGGQTFGVFFGTFFLFGRRSQRGSGGRRGGTEMQ